MTNPDSEQLETLSGLHDSDQFVLDIVLRLQSIYAIAGLTFNALSALRIRCGLKPLSPTNPMVGCVAMFAYSATLLLGFRFYFNFYSVTMIMWALMIGQSGFYSHLDNRVVGNMKGYASATAWSAAVGINLYGIALNIAGAGLAMGINPVAWLGIVVPFVCTYLLWALTTSVTVGAMADPQWAAVIAHTNIWRDR
jgi:hypothetical protein